MSTSAFPRLSTRYNVASVSLIACCSRYLWPTSVCTFHECVLRNGPPAYQCTYHLGRKLIHFIALLIRVYWIWHLEYYVMHRLESSSVKILQFWSTSTDLNSCGLEIHDVWNFNMQKQTFTKRTNINRQFCLIIPILFRKLMVHVKKWKVKPCHQHQLKT